MYRQIVESFNHITLNSGSILYCLRTDLRLFLSVQARRELKKGGEEKKGHYVRS
ncbi:uncharacterized protein CCOS01_03156 [Colletotrichum costaricense]|uniref:Uncharacterized protein n=1 Tax=Colletotrichum costaricense TaxID=1209916 RepID=A0AAI9Z4N6_9PEZI|nr:uncharacterized protein CCOS01_03156 [Colletotrichum costaricense]KAK1534404.1 hypothetical protein CCOS01_03156 [Colletotrichum costaricense]